MTEILIVIGTKPEVVKMAPVIRGLQKHGQEFTFVHGPTLRLQPVDATLQNMPKIEKRLRKHF
jgi:UDP-N-acetylglucosamine 2-epimerase